MDNQDLGIIEFGPFQPDQPNFMNRGAEVASNVLPRNDYYEMMPSVVDLTDSLGSRILGAYTGIDSQRTSFVYAATADCLHQFTVNTWVDVSKVGGYVDADSWEFAAWGDRVIATSLQNQIQSLVVGNPNFSDLTATPIKARRVAVVRNQVFAGDIEDEDGYNSNRIRWCALNNPLDWEVSPVTLSDFQDLKASSGRVQRLFGGEYGLTFTENDIWRSSWIGSPGAWQIEKIDSDLGLIGPGAAVQRGGSVYFISDDGFFQCNGNPSKPIGTAKINRTFLSKLNQQYLDRITSALFIGEQTIVWAYPTSGSVLGTPNRLIMYNYRENRWAEGDEVTEFLFTAASPYTPIDDPATFSSTGLYPTLESVPYSFDDPIWSGGGRFMASATSDHKVGFFNGDAREAVLETGEFQMSPGFRTYVHYCRALHESATENRPRVYVSIGMRNRQSDDVIFTSEKEENAEGQIPFRIEARYTRFRVRIVGNFGPGIGIGVTGRKAGAR